MKIIVSCRPRLQLNVGYLRQKGTHFVLSRQIEKDGATALYNSEELLVDKKKSLAEFVHL